MQSWPKLSMLLLRKNTGLMTRSVKCSKTLRSLRNTTKIKLMLVCPRTHLQLLWLSVCWLINKKDSHRNKKTPSDYRMSSKNQTIWHFLLPAVKLKVLDQSRNSWMTRQSLMRDVTWSSRNSRSKIKARTSQCTATLQARRARWY